MLEDNSFQITVDKSKISAEDSGIHELSVILRDSQKHLFSLNYVNLEIIYVPNEVSKVSPKEVRVVIEEE